MLNFWPSSACPCTTRGTISDTRCVRRRSLQRKCSRDIRYAGTPAGFELEDASDRRPSKAVAADSPRSCYWPAEELLIILNAAIFSIVLGSDNRVSVPEHPTQQGSTVVLCILVVNRKIRILKTFFFALHKYTAFRRQYSGKPWATSSSRSASKASEKSPSA